MSATTPPFSISNPCHHLPFLSLSLSRPLSFDLSLSTSLSTSRPLSRPLDLSTSLSGHPHKHSIPAFAVPMTSTEVFSCLIDALELNQCIQPQHHSSDDESTSSGEPSPRLPPRFALHEEARHQVTQHTLGALASCLKVCPSCNPRTDITGLLAHLIGSVYPDANPHPVCHSLLSTHFTARHLHHTPRFALDAHTVAQHVLQCCAAALSWKEAVHAFMGAPGALHLLGRLLSLLATDACDQRQLSTALSIVQQLLTSVCSRRGG